MQNRRFLYCHHCGNLVGMIHDAKAMITCCGEVMQEPHIVDIDDACHLAVQGHTAVVDTNFPRGEIPQWVYLQTNIGGQRKKMQGFPKVSFSLGEQEIPEVAYCYFANQELGRIEC